MIPLRYKQTLENDIGNFKGNIYDLIEKVLNSNLQRLLRIPEVRFIKKGQFNLHMCLSKALYFNTSRFSELISLENKYLNNLLQDSKVYSFIQNIPHKLKIFRNNISLLRDFTKIPNMEGFEKVFLLN